MADEIPKLHAELRMLRDELEEMEALYVEVRDLCARQMTRQHELNKRHNAALVVIDRVRPIVAEDWLWDSEGSLIEVNGIIELNDIKKALKAFDAIHSYPDAKSPDV